MKARFAALALLLWPSLARACSVCYAANDRNRQAFFDTTLLLSVLPLGMIAGGLWWVMKRGRFKLDEEFAERDAWNPDEAAPAAPAETRS